MPYIGSSPYQVAFLTDTFSGTGTATSFTMSVAPANTASVLVAISGVVQDPSTYSVSGTTLTFSAAPPTGTGNISARYLGIPASGVTTTAYRTITEFTATAGQTTFTPPSYTVGFIEVFRNGVLLGSADYTATNGTTVVLATGATAGDLITTQSFYVSSVLNAIPATAGSVGSTYLANALSINASSLSFSGASGQNPQQAPSKVLQVVQSTNTTQTTITSSSFTTTGHSASITPLFSTSKIYVVLSAVGGSVNGNNIANYTIYRNSTNIAPSSSAFVLMSPQQSATIYFPFAINYLDSPATTSSTTYTVYMASQNNSDGVKYNPNPNSITPSSVLTLMEIAQ